MIDFNNTTNEEIKKYFTENYKLKKNSLELFHEIALLRGGTCLSEKYINNTTSLDFICSQNHQFSSQSKTIKNGSWCPNCANSTKMKHITQNNKESFLKRIEKLGFKLIGELNSTKKESTFECEKGHQFNTLAKNFYKKHYNCPLCIENTGRFKSEHIIRLYLEIAFKQKFVKCKPNWLKMPDTGYNLELDGYCEELKLAYEYQGEQHTTPTAFYKDRLDKFQRRIELDKRKKQLCKQHGITLIEISEIPKQDKSFNNIYNHLITTFKKYNFDLPIIEEKDINLENIYQEDYYSELVKIVESKNGTVESSIYLGSATKMTFKCKEGHLFEIMPKKIKEGQWCSYCAGKKGKNLAQMIKKAIENKGQCISKEYVTSAYKYEFKCENKNHPTFFSSESNLFRGSWCPYCSNNFDLKLNQYNDLVKHHTGILVQSRVIDETRPLQWQCFHKHQFKLTVEDIKSGKWCEKCDRKI
jgi:hypothetical protein